MSIPSSLTTYCARPYHPSSFTPSHPSFRASYGRSRIGFTMRNIIINCLSRSVTNRARLRILLNFANFLESCLPYSTGWPPSWSWWSTSGSLLSTSFHLFKVPVYTVLEVKKKYTIWEVHNRVNRDLLWFFFLFDFFIFRTKKIYNSNSNRMSLFFF